MNTLEDRLRAALSAKSDAVTLDETEHEDLPAEVIRLVPESLDRPRRRIAGVLAAVAAAVVLALAVGTLVAGRGNGRDTDPAGTRSQIPWSRVGADWTLTVTVPATPPTAANGTLYLVDPSGHRYLISSLPPHFLWVEDWKLDTGKALITADSVPATNSGKVLLVDLHTGAQQEQSVPARSNTIQLVGRDGHLLLATSPLWMVTVSDTGQRVATFPGSYFWGSVLSPDGSRVVAGGQAGLIMYETATGRRIRTLAPPTGYGECAAVSGTASGSEVIGSCYSHTQKDVVEGFTFSLTGSSAPRPAPVPSGWRTASFSRGVVAIEHNTTGRYEPRDVHFARVAASGRLVPLTLPEQLRQAGWAITSVGVDSFLLERSVDRPIPGGTGQYPELVELARWNPLTGAFVSLFRASSHQRLVSYAGWRATLPL